MNRETFSYNQIFYNEAIRHLEEKWQRKLTEHEINVGLEFYKFGRRIEMESYYKKEVIDWQIQMRG